MRAGATPPNAAQAIALIQDYLALLAGIDPDAERVTDKMPQNFASIGPIYGMFPNAKIVCCRRDPAENCLSLYTASFRGTMPFVNRRDEIAFFYRQFERIMDHWRRAIPEDRLLELRLEDLTQDRETTTRQLVQFCGLDWDDACLRPEQNKRAVQTSSVWQVRQAVYKPPVARVEGFGPWLDEFRTLLG